MQSTELPTPISKQSPPRRSLNLLWVVTGVGVLCVAALIGFDVIALPLFTVQSCPPSGSNAKNASISKNVDGSSTAPGSGWQNTDISSASQGKLWKPVVWRTFSGKRRESRDSTVKKLPTTGLICSRWAVVTTIFPPTTLLNQLQNLNGWCLVVVGDRKTSQAKWRDFVQRRPDETIYLSPSDQKNLGYSILKVLPWNHFGRKNVGYMYAIHHGAEVIWDTDDDNVLREPKMLMQLAQVAGSKQSIPMVESSHHLWNPYPHFRPIHSTAMRNEEICWPRGFPLEYVKDKSVADSTKSLTSVQSSKIGVYQSLANNDPDIDALYRLTKKMPLSFLSAREQLAIPPGRVAPFNAQATLWRRNTFWGMLLPVTVHGRVTDIWRSYFTQRLMSDLGLHVAFTSPIAVQYRNVHSLVADLQSEIPLYTQADELTKWLRNWTLSEESAKSMSRRIEKLTIDLFEIGILGKKDVKLTQAWLDDLESVDYKMPEVAFDSKAFKKTSEDGELTVAKRPVIRSQANVAVCVSGHLRTLNMSLDDPNHPRKWFQMRSSLPPPNMTVAESIHRNLYPRLGTPDVFMVVSTKETKREPKVGDLSVCEPLRPKGGHLYCSVRQEESVPILNRKLWSEFMLYKVDKLGDMVIQGLLQQLKGMFECHAEIKRHSLRTGKEYDWIVRLRPDNYIHSFPSLETLALDSQTPTIWHGTFRDCCCGNEDRLGIAPARWIRDYFDRFLYIQQVPWTCTRTKCSSWNAERFLVDFLRSYRIRLRQHPQISMCTVKPKYRRTRSEP